MSHSQYVTRGGVTVQASVVAVSAEPAIDALIESLNERVGVLLASNYEYQDRYTRWDLGFVDPPLELTARARAFRIVALNARGRILIGAIAPILLSADTQWTAEASAHEIVGEVFPLEGSFPEEERSRQPSVFSVVRAIVDLLASDQAGHLGLYGAFGYDLAFQFDPIQFRLPRSSTQRDLVLYLPDELVVVDHRRGSASRISWEFAVGQSTTQGLPREGQRRPYRPSADGRSHCDHASGAYAEVVREAIQSFRRGDLFEVVPSQTFFEPCSITPGELYRRLRATNPSPFGACINLGEGEYLVSASPEMFVRVQGSRVETCPIAGTIARGADALGDAEQIQKLLNSYKDESELTMCTDVDRNDKSRVCRPGSVRVLGRRLIETYSRLIHTVDHVEGRLREDRDAMDALLSHAWAVTVTGAPKRHAMQFIEDHEQRARGWYGGAIGVLGFDGSANTGITIRTVHIQDGVAEVRAGATLLFESDPEAEEKETRLKASALLNALRLDLGSSETRTAIARSASEKAVGAGKRILLVDHDDSFVLTLASYLRETGAEVRTLRAGFPWVELDRFEPHLCILSPGPGRPSDFSMRSTLSELIGRQIPVFGVCLGLQAMAEYYGGELSVLASPMHGKASEVRVLGGQLFRDFPQRFVAGRYHSLYANRARLPEVLEVTAETDDGIVMAIEHREARIAAVQFHPESIMTLHGGLGKRLLFRLVEMWCG